MTKMQKFYYSSINAVMLLFYSSISTAYLESIRFGSQEEIVLLSSVIERDLQMVVVVRDVDSDFADVGADRQVADRLEKLAFVIDHFIIGLVARDT